MSRLRAFALGAGLVGTLLLLLLHAAEYRFLTDDAFISFRYAAHLSQGHGLVFNPGSEPVEGYTNFLWVVILAGLNRVGLQPELAAQLLGAGLTVGLWGLVVWFVGATNPQRRSWLILVPPLFLASTRSVAVWSSGGLETRLFEVLVLAGLLRLVLETREALMGSRPAPVSGLLLALATLTRPDGLLVCGSCFVAAWSFLALRRRFRISFAMRGLVAYVPLVTAHTLFRWLYYGDWLPNTYYAKVGGRTWWSAGAAYFGAFALEYALYLWLPLLAVAVWHHVKRGTGYVPVLFGAAIGPHLLYVVAIGGDHFEYRPFDIVFPFAFLLMYDGAMTLGRRAIGRWVAFIWLALVLWGLVAIPYRSHVQSPETYVNGFPGLAPNSAGFLDPDRDPVYRLPGLRSIARAHRLLLDSVTRRFVGLRQEEHAAFLSIVAQEGRKLRELVRTGQLPPDTHLAIDAVGAIPYYSDLPVLDRLGLTDRQVAKSEAANQRLLAHDKHATLEYARSREVDLWAVDNVHLVYRIDDPAFVEELWRARDKGIEAYHADLGQGYHLLCQLPLGPQRAARRFPELRFVALVDDAGVRLVLQQALKEFQGRLASDPGNVGLRFAAAEVLSWLGQVEESILQYRQVLRLDPGHFEAAGDLAVLIARQGRIEEAIALLDRAIARAPTVAILRYNMGAVLLQAQRYPEAVDQLRQAVALRPGFAEALHNLGYALSRTGHVEEGIEHYREALRLRPTYGDAHLNLAVALSQLDRIAEAVPHYEAAIRVDRSSVAARNNLAWIRATAFEPSLHDPQEAIRLATEACELTDYGEPFYLVTLSVAYAEAGRFDDAVRWARKALTLSPGRTEIARQAEALIRRFEARQPYRETADPPAIENPQPTR